MISPRSRTRSIFIRATSGVVLMLTAAASLAGEWSLKRGDGSATIELAGRPIAEYVWRDEQIPRPYLRNLRTPSGIQVTRNQPPVAGQDIDDHPMFHPGIWLAFGDLNGVDFWRNKGRVRQTQLRELPTSADGLVFEARQVYESDDGPVCEESSTIGFFKHADGYRIDWTTTFHAGERELAFGDQEEMGFGVRVASPLAVVRGGEIVNSDGARNGKEAWGKQADWCAYRGTLEGRQVGVLLAPDPANFRRSWFHARDYGLLVANPFGRRAFTKGEPSRVIVAKGNDLQLRFGLLVFETKKDATIDSAALSKYYEAIAAGFKKDDR